MVFRIRMEPGPGHAYGGWTGGLEWNEDTRYMYVYHTLAQVPATSKVKVISFKSYFSNPLYSNKKLVGRPGTVSEEE